MRLLSQLQAVCKIGAYKQQSLSAWLAHSAHSRPTTWGTLSGLDSSTAKHPDRRSYLSRNSSRERAGGWDELLVHLPMHTTAC